jgi:hypothetical protein
MHAAGRLRTLQTARPTRHKKTCKQGRVLLQKASYACRLNAGWPAGRMLVFNRIDKRPRENESEREYSVVVETHTPSYLVFQGLLIVRGGQDSRLV